jgi:hypothetical protein
VILRDRLSCPNYCPNWSLKVKSSRTERREAVVANRRADSKGNPLLVV